MPLLALRQRKNTVSLQTVPTNSPWETDRTAKVSEVHRRVFYYDMEDRRYELLDLLDRVLQYGPSTTQLEAFTEALAGMYFVFSPEMGEDQPAGHGNEEGEVDRHGNAGQDDRASRACPKRNAIAADICRLLQMPADDTTKFAVVVVEICFTLEGHYSGKLEAFLDHLDEHNCHRSAAPAHIAAAEGPGRQAQAEDPDSHRAFINPKFAEILQEEIDRADAVISHRHIKRSSGHDSRHKAFRARHEAFRARIEFRGRRGWGSPLVAEGIGTRTQP
ncbi:hypothetical protein E4U32_001282 [Claviceps aff. humidiphila group G2b]|nr:hypothetical protein E4U32_001282 [Claviceps aff. humidiphila group G2b]